MMRNSVRSLYCSSNAPRPHRNELLGAENSRSENTSQRHRERERERERQRKKTERETHPSQACFTIYTHTYTYTFTYIYISKKCVYICLVMNHQGHNNIRIGIVWVQRGHSTGICTLNFEHIKNSNRSKKSQRRNSKFESAK